MSKDKIIKNTLNDYGCSQAFIEALKQYGGTLSNKKFILGSNLEKITKLPEDILGRSAAILRDNGEIYTAVYVKDDIKEIELAYSYNNINLPGQIVPDKIKKNSLRYFVVAPEKNKDSNKLICLPEVNKEGVILNSGLEKVIDKYSFQSKLI